MSLNGTRWILSPPGSPRGLFRFPFAGLLMNILAFKSASRKLADAFARLVLVLAASFRKAFAGICRWVWERLPSANAHLALLGLPRVCGLNASETFRLRSAKRGRPTVTARWRMCPSI